jgi:hypothetical protein
MIHKNLFWRFIMIAFVGTSLFSSCSPSTTDIADVEPPSVGAYKIEAADDWSSLFLRSSGWFGGDGIFAIPLNGSDYDSKDDILFVFSDTMFGEVKDGVLQPGWQIPNNSVMVLHGNEPKPDNAEFFVKTTPDKKAQSVFIPNSPKAQAGDYFWIGDGLTDNGSDKIYLFAYRIRNTNDGSMFPFKEVGGTMLVLPKGAKIPFDNYNQLDLPFPTHEEDSMATSFGGAVLNNIEAAGVPDPDGYLYIYGVRGKAKELIVTRVKPGSIEDFKSWEFKTSGGWSNDLKSAQGFMDSVSNEFSVSPIGNGKYALVYQLGGIDTRICLQIGSSPSGPFGPRAYIYNTAKDISGKDLITYNAKAHPALSKPGELLVSYNVNSFSFLQQIEKTPNFYRPRFFRVVFEK